MDQYEKFVGLAGKKVRRAPREKTELIFNLADNEQRERMIRRLETEISIFEDMLEAHEPLENPSRHLWRFLLKSRITPCSDLFDKISKTDTIQVFGRDLRLVFASLNLFDHVSFTLDQIFDETWQTAVKREEKIAQDLYVDFMQMFSGEIRQTTECKTPPHLVEEVGTEELVKSRLHIKWLSPAFSGDTVSCIISMVEIVNL